MAFNSAKALLLSIAAAAAEETVLTINVGTQNGFFQSRPNDPGNSGDIGPMNPHDYRPNEFVTSDFMFDGLVIWDGSNPKGLDGIADNDDDFVSPSLATSWVTQLLTDATDSSKVSYKITFTLREGVKFHDGSAWNAAAAEANFDQIMGGKTDKVLKGMHDWLGFTQYLDSWTAESDMAFSLTFDRYHESAFRELATIRPFRMSSLAALPDITKFELSHMASKKGALRHPWPKKCRGNDDIQCYMFRGVSTPIGTGAYQVVEKVLAPTGRRIPAADFNHTCYSHPTGDDYCVYNAGEYVSEVIFVKNADHWRKPTYDKIVLKAYDSRAAVSRALQDGSLDIAYGLNTLAPATFISLATAEGGDHLVGHQSPTDLNVRHATLNSGSDQLLTRDLRKYIFSLLAPARQDLYEGELAEEDPMDTLFDPSMPYCGVLKTFKTSEQLAATGDPKINKTHFTRPLRLMYRAYEPHSVMIAAEVSATLYNAGIEVTTLPVKTREVYNELNCDYLDGFDYDGTPTDDGCDPAADDYLTCMAQHHAWDIALSRSWGPPYDPTSKLWDMTHNWCSAEADAPAVINMDSMTVQEFNGKVRVLSSIQSDTARQAAYTEILSTLHQEAIFLPISALRQTAVVNKRVSGFQFGYMEFDLPLANLYPTPPPPPPSDDDSLSDGAIAGIAVAAGVACLLCMLVSIMFVKERSGTPIFTPMKSAKSYPDATA